MPDKWKQFTNKIFKAENSMELEKIREEVANSNLNPSEKNYLYQVIDDRQEELIPREKEISRQRHELEKRQEEIRQGKNKKYLPFPSKEEVKSKEIMDRLMDRGGGFCPHCNKGSFRTKQALREHIRHKHPRAWAEMKYGKDVYKESLGDKIKRKLPKPFEKRKNEREKRKNEREEIERLRSMAGSVNWKCTNCGWKNPPDKDKCENCGYPRGFKKEEGKEPKESGTAEGEPTILKDVTLTKPCPKCGGQLWDTDEKGTAYCPDCQDYVKVSKLGKTQVFTHALLPVVIAAIIAFALALTFGSTIDILSIGIGIILVSFQGIFGSEGAGGYAKAVFRTLGYIMIGLGLFWVFGQTPLLKIIPLLVLGFEIITYPVPETANTEEQIGLELMRTVLGAFLTLIFALTFQGIMEANPNLFFSFISLSIAFFITVPVAGSEIKSAPSKALKFFKQAGEQLGSGTAEKLKKVLDKEVVGGKSLLSFLIKFVVGIIIVLFLISFGLLSFYPTYSQLVQVGWTYGVGAIVGFLVFVIGVYWASRESSTNGVMLGIFGGSGIMLGSLAFANLPVSQGLIGYFFFILIVTFGVISAAPVVNARPLIGVPIIFIAIMSATVAYPDIMGEATFGVWWPKIDHFMESNINPILQSLKQPLGTFGEGFRALSNPVAYYQDYQPQTSTKETVSAVEITSLEPIGPEKITMSHQNFPVSLVVENKGSKLAKNIKVDPDPPEYSHGTAAGETAGSVEIMCEEGFEGTCGIDKLWPEGLREFVLNYTVGEGDGGYLQRGNYITMAANIQYKYNVSGKVELEVLNKDYYNKLARSDNLNKRELTTQDTGGPVRLGVALMKNKMPIRDDIPGLPIMLYLENQGPGVIGKIESAYIDISDLSEEEGKTIYCTAGDVSKGDKQKDLKGLEDYMIGIEKEGGKIVKQGEKLKAYCFAKVPDIDVDQKTYQLRGMVQYKYYDDEEYQMEVDFGALFKCECINDEGAKKYLLVFGEQCKMFGNKECKVEKNGEWVDMCEDAFPGYKYSGKCLGKQDLT